MSSKADMYGINNSKACADWEKYASLFQKHVSSLENGSVCFISLGNIDVIFKLLENFKKCKVYIYDNKSICESAKFLASMNGFNEEQFIFNSSDDILESIKESTMKFDRIVMNPPYQRGLHIKILNAAKSQLATGGTIVSLQPIVKWQEAKLFHKDSPVESINVHSRVSLDEAYHLFGIEQRCELGILSNFESSIEVVDNFKFLDRLYAKLNPMCSNTLRSHLEDDDKEFPIAFGDGCTIAGHGGHGAACYRITGYHEDKACRKGEIGHTKRCNASSKDEQHQIWKFYQNPIMRFIYKEFGFGGIPYNIIPFITEFKDENGKTPLDYEWTTSDFVKYFEISKDELDIIYKSLKAFLYEDERVEFEKVLNEKCK